MNRPAIIILLLIALSLVFSCGKADPPVAPATDNKDSAEWQKAQWDACSKELQKHLGTEGREQDLSTLDAAYVALAKADTDYNESQTIHFQSDGTSCEAVMERNAQGANLKVFRGGELIGYFSGDNGSYTGESAGISLNYNNEGEAVLRSRDVVLATLKKSGGPDIISVALDLITGISIRGMVDSKHLWNAVRSLQDANSEAEARAFVKEAAGALDLPVFYEGDLSAAHAKLTLVPEHILSRYDDYWTWKPVILTVSGETLVLSASSPLNLLFDGTLPFYKAWKSLMPHIVK